jgi:hypothetical protein
VSNVRLVNIVLEQPIQRKPPVTLVLAFPLPPLALVPVIVQPELLMAIHMVILILAQVWVLVNHLVIGVDKETLLPQ